MGLNIAKGQMYEWVSHTWNTVKGKCPHDCSYCYVKRWGKQNSVRFDEKELKTDLGSGNFIFVGSSCDMWADDIPLEWIGDTMDHCSLFTNRYLFQSKNPGRIEGNLRLLPDESVVCTTIESNRFIESIMKNSPPLKDRAFAMNEIAHHNIKTYVTIEPIMDFDLKELSYLIETCLPEQVNIGADSGGHGLPEPSKEKILELIAELSQFTVVKQKKNLKRLLK